jgi:hypothetical protein
MTIHCCDNCEGVIKGRRGWYSISHALTTLQLCPSCAEPMLRLILKHRMIMPGLITDLMTDPFADLKENEYS